MRSSGGRVLDISVLSKGLEAEDNLHLISNSNYFFIFMQTQKNEDCICLFIFLFIWFFFLHEIWGTLEFYLIMFLKLTES